MYLFFKQKVMGPAGGSGGSIEAGPQHAQKETEWKQSTYHECIPSR